MGREIYLFLVVSVLLQLSNHYTNTILVENVEHRNQEIEGT